MDVELNSLHVPMHPPMKSGYLEQFYNKSYQSLSPWKERPVSMNTFPMSLAEIYSDKDMFDPLLNVTPEKQLPRLVRLNVSDEEESNSGNLRHTKVHFDQTVAVHHFSPEVSTDTSSIGNSPTNSRFASQNGLSTYYSDILTSNLSPSALGVDLSSGDHADISLQNLCCVAPDDDSTGQLKLGKKSMSSVNETGKICSLTKDLKDFGIKDSSSDLKLSDSLEPISIVASDLRPLSDGLSKIPKKLKTTTSMRSQILSSANLNGTRSSSLTSNLGKSELVSSSSLQTLSPGAGEGILSQPKLNSTLRLTKEMTDLKTKEFDKYALRKKTLDPKIKGKIDEKAYTKLNVDQDMYTNLVSLEVQEEELLNRVTEAQLAKVKAESGGKVKTEDLINRPDIMEYFTDDLQPEFPSYTLFGIVPERLEPWTVDLDRAFDLYRHIRVWEKF